MGIYVRHGTWISYEAGLKISKIKVHDAEPSYHLIDVDLAEISEDNSYLNLSFKYKQPLKKLQNQT